MATVKFEKVHKDILDFLLKLAEENKCRVKQTEWRSKYNSYVVYDYEPFCSDGFEINVEIQGRKAFLNFIQYLYNKRIKQIHHLNLCFYQKRMAGAV